MATHEMRITNHGTSEKPEEPLVLHTLPAPPKERVADQPEGSGSHEPPSKSNVASGKEKERIPPSAATVPRLISVVEIIKREYLKQIAAVHQDHGKLTGLYQYNQVGCLPDPEPESEVAGEEARVSALSSVLRGKNHLRIKKSPYMKVILSRRQLDEEQIRSFTYVSNISI
ncbi:hypothetical protein EUX98_g8694 [Antrodiella citrinella]|uniref:Uncharacterized protein n=1 Tax=Antrodiella citrinella TaxID=2447956 RepID=A0A4S4M444_9APHY|nr:hypothetical protein EUX98_g8694 [Antrodiella citrinella]